MFEQITSCVDAPDAMGLRTVRTCDRVRSCVRPFLCGHSICRWPVWRCVDQVQISVASSRALYVSLVFPIPISSIVWSLLFSSSSHHADCTVILPVRPELQNPPDASSLPKLRARSCWQARSPQAYEASAQAYVPAKSPRACHSLSPSVCGSWRL